MSMQRPVIGITRKGGLPPESHRAYRDRVAEAGGDPVDLTPGMGPAAEVIHDLGIQGVLFSGGGDLNPAIYGEKNEASSRIDDDRDKFELDLMRVALDADLPILAICRGFQLLNVVCGGKLLQDVSKNQTCHAARANLSVHHEVDIRGDSRLGQLFGERRLRVNSRHHQAVREDMVGRSLVAAAISTGEDIIEAIELVEQRWVVGVQWHPERVQDEIGNSCRPLFTEFVRVAALRKVESHK